MPAGLAQEELQRVGRRLPRDGERWQFGRRRLRLDFAVVAEVVHDVDLPRLELAVHEVDLERVEAERLEHVVQLRLQHRAALLGHIDQPAQVVAQEEDVGLRCHADTI